MGIVMVVVTGLQNASAKELLDLNNELIDAEVGHYREQLRLADSEEAVEAWEEKVVKAERKRAITNARITKLA